MDKLLLPLLFVGSIAYAVIFCFEEMPYSGEVETISGNVEKSAFIYGGASSGRSYTKIYRDDGRVYRLPIGEKVAALKGDRIVMTVPRRVAENRGDELPVIGYELIRGDHFKNTQ